MRFPGGEEASKMRKYFYYSWLVFQMLVGIWLFISPFVYGVGETRMSTNNMIFGPIIVLLAIGAIFYQVYHKEAFETERLERPVTAEHPQRA